MARTATDVPFADFKNVPDAMRDFYRAITALLRGQSNTTGTISPTVGTTSTTITEPIVTQASHISITPTNASAALLIGAAASVYVSARTHGVSFTVTHGLAAGTENFSYSISG